MYEQYVMSVDSASCASTSRCGLGVINFHCFSPGCPLNMLICIVRNRDWKTYAEDVRDRVKRRGQLRLETKAVSPDCERYHSYLSMVRKR